MSESQKNINSRVIVRRNEDVKLTTDIINQLAANGGYCPCRITKNEDTKCMCKEFREQKDGMCHCGLYIKEVVNEN